MIKLDLRKELKHLYSASAKQVQVVNVPACKFAMIDGALGGDEAPATSEEFQQAVEALYGVAYTLKFMSKLRETNPIDYPVMALEGLWWTAAGEFDFNRKEDWRWTLMIMQPDHITPAMFQQALRKLRDKKDKPALPKLRLEKYREGLAVQIMHVGPYADEPRTIERMHTFAQENGYILRGKHHEIYLGDPRRAKPDKLKTILRQPISKPRR